MSTLTHPETALSILKVYWGYESFLPMQELAVQAILDRQDSVVILPTGGGKSLCFQLPAMMMPGTMVVVSPLVSLMKDQVDTLTGLGVSALFVNNSLTEAQRRETLYELQEGNIKLLYVAPERFTSEAFINTLQTCHLSAFVIDEAHCISQWGHDFRPAYREMSQLRARFPHLAVHAFTATATEPVRADMVQALRLRNPQMLVGNFDRPNLLYRVQYRNDLLKQVCQVVDRHPGEGGVIYCISRKDVDELTLSLKKEGYNVLPYHAGLSNEVRQANQEAFLSEQVDIVVATVAFGMGIDRSNIRYVIHTGMPKSIEHYQQEAGRAGRDRLQAECVLFYSGGDVGKWRTIMGKPETVADQAALGKLYEMSNYCQQLICRHRFLVEYFGQPFEAANCHHCDFCLGEYEVLAEGQTVARKILSCVYRVEERFGAQHVAQVLSGGNTEKIRQFGHERLSTHGLLKEYRQKDLVHWIEQLVNQQFLVKDPDYGTLKITVAGAQLLKGKDLEQLQVLLAKPVKRAESSKTSNAGEEPLSSSEAILFDALRQVRKSLAGDRGVPPYVIFGDVTLQEMARRQPKTLYGFRGLKGVGETKLRELCPHFLVVILKHHGTSISDTELQRQVERLGSSPSQTVRSRRPTQANLLAKKMFQGQSRFEEVVAATGKTESTVLKYLCEYIGECGIQEPEPWISQGTFDEVTQRVLQHQTRRLKLLYEALNETVSYGEIKIALALLENVGRAV